VRDLGTLLRDLVPAWRKTLMAIAVR